MLAPLFRPARPGIHIVELPDSEAESVPAPRAGPLAQVDVAIHRRTRYSQIAGCGMPARQEQLTDDGGHVTCRRPGCR